MPAAHQDPFRILLVCTGNICRSAFAERLGRAWLEETLGQDVGILHVASAGTRAVVGSAMHPDSALVLRGFGVEAGDFRARQLRAEHVDRADLVLTMTRAHRNAVLTLAPRAMARTFALREAAALLSRSEEADVPEVEFSGAPSGERARQVVQRLTTARRHRASDEGDDIRDPIGQPVEVHEEVAELIVAALLPLLRRLGGQESVLGDRSSAKADVDNADGI
ncbi:hypothetical protein [Blastococcus sp. CT_GayMR20]|uniref:arsenate reductase/protein-tyrosine-phosphatase family protein n=1 Tax=Blastococcus sp. CT_GayMR20 TaxID=2559609 RepID=UPI0014307418|nr:hypothetical protein [Blastococcus sp. CT_GayMR20]